MPSPMLKRRLKALQLNTGEISYEYVNVSCTLAHHIRAIASLNMKAHIYGVVYMPDDEDAEYLEYVLL